MCTNDAGACIRAYANAQIRKSPRKSHIQCVDVDIDYDQNRWLCQHECLLEVLPPIRQVLKSNVLAHLSITFLNIQMQETLYSIIDTIYVEYRTKPYQLLRKKEQSSVYIVYKAVLNGPDGLSINNIRKRSMLPTATTISCI